MDESDIYHIKLLGKVPLLTKEQEISLGEEIIEYKKKVDSFLRKNWRYSLQKYQNEFKRTTLEERVKRSAQKVAEDIGKAYCLSIYASDIKSEDISSLIDQSEKIYSTIKEPSYDKILKFKQKDLSEFVSNLNEFYRARNSLALPNMRLVINIAKKYQRPEMDLFELITEGACGLLKAASKYDPKIARFSTFAYMEIECLMRRALNDKIRNIRIPINVQSDFRKYWSAYERLRKKDHIKPSAEELAYELNMPISKIEEINEILHSVTRLGSLNKTVDDDGNIEVQDMLEGKSRSAEQEVYEITLKNIADYLMDSVFNEKEKKIFAKRYGLADGVFHTLKEIGDEYHVTRERVRQIELRAIKKVRRLFSESKAKEIENIKNFIKNFVISQ